MPVLPASIPLPLSRNDSIEVANQRRLLRTLEQLTNRLKRTLAKQPLSSFHVSSEMIVADPKSLEGKKASLFCRPGSVLKGRMCGEWEGLVSVTIYKEITFYATLNEGFTHLNSDYQLLYLWIRV